MKLMILIYILSFNFSKVYANETESKAYNRILQKYLKYGQISEKEMEESNLIFQKGKSSQKIIKSQSRMIASKMKKMRKSLKINAPTIELTIKED